MLRQLSKKLHGYKFKIVSALLVVLLIYFSYIFMVSWQKNHQANEQISNLRQNITTLQQQNAQFKQLIDYFNSSAYIEDKARTSLGLKKTGEKVLMVSGLSTSSSTNGLDSTTTQPRVSSNPVRWLHYFFQ